MLLEITDEIADQVVLNALKDSIECVSQSISELEELDKLREYQVADLDYDRDILIALEKVYDYFGGNL